MLTHFRVLQLGAQQHYPAATERLTAWISNNTVMLVIGDVHADQPANKDALEAIYDEVDPACALQVGDLLWYDVPVPTWFIAGNNEEFDIIDALRAGNAPERASNVQLLAGNVVELEGLRITGLSGNHAPTQYDKSRSELSGDRRRHFVRDDVQRVNQNDDIDVLLTHEAPHGLLRTNGYEVGCTHIDEILNVLSPEICLVGHHHRHGESTFDDTRVVSLAPVWDSYYELNPDTLSLDRYPSPGREGEDK